jgi:hypothetical protein
VKEKLQEIYEGLKERLKSPFILTFILVWSVHHWRLLFHLITFDSETNQNEKFNYVNNYIIRHGWDEMFWTPVGYSILSFGGYLLAALLFESITELYEKWGRTAILLLINRNKTVKREDMEKVQLKLKNSEKAYNQLEKEYAELETEVQDLDNEVKELTAENSAYVEAKKELEGYRTKNKREDDFIYSKTRKALFHVFDFFSKENHITNHVEAKIENLFFGVWNRAEYNNIDLSQRTEHQIRFSGESVFDIHDEIAFKVTGLTRFDPLDVYSMRFTTKNNLQVEEILFKVSNDLIVGKIGANNEEIVKFVEYKKISS